ncbi:MULTISPECIES: transcription termination factor Rho [Nocardiopsis]|uniref:Transcription termination factor Rho n=1 Tax=Nocardiopsis sinuspersici TaxID=501010 RepID=A0A1V3BW90_9ACTN|nr:MULTISPECIES: transcription termination factor Rho [Nocardiopsis]NYH53759.1 transcription termination factor Rho [Nocardiopsis sinuspersici]OOC52688.1 transcription termination factor Rho [Nocardiopsis sinuspersici]
MSDTTELRTDAAVDSKTTTGASGAEAGEAAPTGASSRPRAASRGTGLAALKLPELQKLASSLGITGTGRMRKSDVIAAIEAKQGGPVSSPAKAKSAKNAETVPKAGKVEATDGQTEAQVPNTSGTDEAPRKRVAEQPSDQAVTDTQGGRGDKPPRGRRSSRRRGDEPGEQTRSVDGTDSTTSASSVTKTSSTPQKNGPDSSEDRDTRSGQGRERQRNRRNRNRGGDDQNTGGNAQQGGGGQNQGRGGGGDDDDFGGGRRRGRRRDRRDRRGRGGAQQEPEPVIGDDDVLLPVAGILDILDNYAFVRTTGYLPGQSDVYVSLAQVRKHGLRKGDHIIGAVRQPRDGERREKFNALVRLDSVNGMSPDQAKGRQEFSKLVPLYPQDRLRLETEPHILTTRIIDLVAPIGKGQRGLIVSPPKAGKTMVVQAIANAITENNPECYLMVVLVDERPEEVTDMQRTVKGEVIHSTFDRPAEDHTVVADLAIERAKRLVEMGMDVVVLLDSITRLGRAYNLAAPASGRIMSGGVDSTALYPPKRFFGAARNIEGGGSLTILATALVETGSRADEVIFEEFKGTGNMELKLNRSLADRRIFPAVDVDASSTRKEEILMSPEELNVVWKLRRVLHALDAQQAIELLLDKMKESKSNAEFLLQIQKTTVGPER